MKFFLLLMHENDLHGKKLSTCSGLMKTGLSNVVLLTLHPPISLTTMDSVGSKTFFDPVFINPEQVDIFAV